MKFILGRKLNMSQVFSPDGQVVPVTVVEAGPCTITQVKAMEKDGYSAAQVGFLEKPKLLKPLLGHLKGLKKFRYLKEFRLDKGQTVKKGQEITVGLFSPGEIIKVSGTSKGKGFQGVVKRHGFHGAPASHGHKDQLRMPGSIGTTDPARVFKGKRMAGRMGSDQVTLANLEIVQVEPDKNLLYIKGAVPGARNGLVMIKAEGEFKEAVKERAKEEAPQEDLRVEEKKQAVGQEETKAVEPQKAAEEKPKEEKKAEAITEEK